MAFVAIAENPGSVYRTRMVATTVLNCSSRGLKTPDVHIVPMHIYRQDAHKHKLKSLKFSVLYRIKIKYIQNKQVNKEKSSDSNVLEKRPTHC